ncbi:MAG: NTP transferase domain-containing protein [Chitinophagaceae bacterium]|nr:NTP transferase domain-containing protein [Chitinophagaceae bacterium]
MINNAIILAGGLGTRLRSIVSGLPKCMAPVAGKPFLYYVISHLQKQGVTDFIFSVGYKSKIIQSYLSSHFSTLNYQLSIEDEPLGTGGAIKFSLSKVSSKNIIIANGDTFFKIDLKKLSSFHEASDATCTLNLKPMVHFDRYGVVDLNNDGSIESFHEKQFYKNGLINGGLYALNKNYFLKTEHPQIFSFEKDYLEKIVNNSGDKKEVYGIIQDEYFIDIGIPADYKKAQEDFSHLAI